jgi:hypothetical protein
MAFCGVLVMNDPGRQVATARDLRRSGDACTVVGATLRVSAATDDSVAWWGPWIVARTDCPGLQMRKRILQNAHTHTHLHTHTHTHTQRTRTHTHARQIRCF